MTIEAGYDLLELLVPKVLTPVGAKRKCNTWVIAMDEGLRYLGTQSVRGGDAEQLDGRIDRVVKALNKLAFNPVKYYVLAHLDSDLSSRMAGWANCAECPELESLHDSLEAAPELAAHTLLGVYISDGSVVCGSVPRYSFRDYPLLHDLPRTAVFSGPHQVDCACPACTQFEEKLRQNRARGGDHSLSEGGVPG